jgi:serine-type D-Ala-D-Ala carboxypeptidase (penicillin-binding protein 5/6)
VRLGVAAMAAIAMLTCGLAQAEPGLRDSKADHIAILDFESGLLLDCKNCNTPMPPASMSKLMTMLIVAEQLKAGKIKAETTFKVSEKAWRHGAQSDGSHMFLGLGSAARVDDLIRGVIIVSANDACIVLAEGIAGSEASFVDLMNRRAQELGLKTARFRNVTGLPDPDHLISAADLARLAAIIIRDHADLYAIYKQGEFSFAGKTQQNRNPLLGKVDGADGVKTGHTNDSGYGLVGSAERNGQRRIIVFNGLPTMAARASEAQRLMNAAFFDYDVTKLADKGSVVGEAQVRLGGRKTVPLIAAQTIFVGAHRAIKSDLKAHVSYVGPLTAPVAAGAQVGALIVEGPGFARQEYPLVTATKVGRANLFARFGADLAALAGAGS